MGLGDSCGLQAGTNTHSESELSPSCSGEWRDDRQDIPEVEAMLEKGAILPVKDPSNQGFYSRIYLVPKKDGQSRPVVNLHPLNQYLLCKHFKMEGIHVVRDLLL